MSRFSLRFIFAVAGVISSLSFASLASAKDMPSSNTITTRGQESDNGLRLPPLPAGVTDIAFNEFYKMPMGPQGPEPTEKLLSLNNKHVRVVGYMAKEDDPTPGIFMLAARPVNVGEKADGMADDLPAATLYVHMPSRDADKILSYRPAPWVLTGVLQVGNKEESNDRISFVRLIMEQGDIDSAKKKEKKH